MKHVILTSIFCAMTTAGAMGQTPTTPPPSSPTAPETNAPQPGANSFTEAQAKSRLEANGCTAVTDLKKDSSGVWRAKATLAGQPVNVGLDYRGNVIRN